MTRRTKIVCTIGPSTDDPQILGKLMDCGMNVVRLNFSHGCHEEHLKRVKLVKDLRQNKNLPVALLLDMRGPEIRTKKLQKESVSLEENQNFLLTGRDIPGDETGCAITYPSLCKDVLPGTKILLDDGLIELQVTSIQGEDINCIVLNNGVLKNDKSINIPGVKIGLPYMTLKDKEDIIFAIENDFDFIAASFVRTKEDVMQVRQVLEENGGADIQIISKIENQEGVENFDEIVRVSDGIMVARGDMGVEIPIEDIPRIQKMLIRKCRNTGKTVITATQMLDSMIRNPRPTRAETTDVANAIYDGTSAIMLSGETAIGKYPVESVIMMDKIAQNTENDINYYGRFKQFDAGISSNVTNAISHATCTTALDLGASAIITVTTSGHTARMVSKFRPDCQIIAATSSEKSWRQMALIWGINPFMVEQKETTDELFEVAVEAALKSGKVKSGDLVVITGGVPIGISGTTNLLKVHIVGNVLAKGERVNQYNVCGTVCVCKSIEEARMNFKDGDILVVSKTDNSLFDILKRAKGIITEAGGLSSHAAVVGLSLDIPVVCGAAGATDILKSGTTVTIDSSRGLVFAGEHLDL
jgi:pyruvate kinase